MSTTARQAELQTRLEKVSAALNGTLDRNAAGYSINGRAIQSFSLADLMKLEAATRNELARLQRGGRFGGVGFKGVTS